MSQKRTLSGMKEGQLLTLPDGTIVDPDDSDYSSARLSDAKGHFIGFIRKQVLKEIHAKRQKRREALKAKRARQLEVRKGMTEAEMLNLSDVVSLSSS